MALLDTIKNGLSNTTGKAFAYGTVQYRVMTSKYNTIPRTYGGWTTITNARVITNEMQIVQDDRTGMLYTVEMGECRIPFSSNVELAARQTQIKWTDPSTGLVEIWDVTSRLNHNAGSITGYTLERKVPFGVNPRDGAV